MTTPPWVFAVGGENLIDEFATGDSPVQRPGGAALNVARALGRQGAQVRYVTPISTDPAGDVLAQSLADTGVALAGGRIDAPTSRARIWVQDGQPTYDFLRDGTAERAVTCDGLLAAIGQEAWCLHTGGLALADGHDAAAWEGCCVALQAQGRVVSVDVNIRPPAIHDWAAYRARIARCVAQAALVKVSDEDLSALYPTLGVEAAIAALRADAPAALILLTLGAEGARALLPTLDVTVPSHPVTAMTDTVGAGDTFIATVLTGLVDHGATVPSAVATLGEGALVSLLDKAARAAAITCTRVACDPPTAAELGVSGRAALTGL